ncbi:MAG TPA: hypothetical protein PK985_09130 [Bacillota bacterium]|nr:hypothetical protein [Bacillota bacterium]
MSDLEYKIPERYFDGEIGKESVGIGGPDAIEETFDEIITMFDPGLTHKDGKAGGIDGMNMKEKTITAREIADNAIEDRAVGTRTFNENIADEYSKTGTLSQHLSWIWKYIQSITGTSPFAAVADTIAGLSSKVAAGVTALNNHKSSGDHDGRYYEKSLVYSREELIPYLQGGDTIRRIEVYTIVNSNNGDGTFTYKDKDNEEYIGDLDESGYQIFELRQGRYTPGLNMVEAIINDTLHRSQASGGLEEVDETHVKLTDPQGNGAEITFLYFERIGIGGEHRIYYTGVVGGPPPPDTSDAIMWIEVIEVVE